MSFVLVATTFHLRRTKDADPDPDSSETPSLPNRLTRLSERGATKDGSFSVCQEKLHRPLLLHASSVTKERAIAGLPHLLFANCLDTRHDFLPRKIHAAFYFGD